MEKQYDLCLEVLRRIQKIDIPELLKDLGLILDFHIKGYIRISHPELINTRS